jgi:hypothetical protein
VEARNERGRAKFEDSGLGLKRNQTQYLQL